MRRIIFLISLFIVFGLKAQKITFSGVVLDSLNKPLNTASLVAINQETKALDSYAIT